MNNIIEIVEAEKNLDILARGVKAAGLESELKKNGPYTIFAPTDMAFGKLTSSTVTELLRPENKLKLADILKNHVVEGETHLKDLKDGQKLKTLGGKELFVQVKDGKIMISGVTVSGQDIPASNGSVLFMNSLFNLS
ncbi:MAG: fasciclin domain-containing protein [Ferruginibacter sp.]